MLTLWLVVVAAAPTPLDLIWNISPSPHATYDTCDHDVTVCVVEGDWYGICRSEQFGAAKKTLVSGAMTLKDGAAQFSGCPFYEALISKKTKLGGEPATAMFAAPGCETTAGKAKVGAAPFGEKTIAYKSNPDGSLQFAELPRRVETCDAIASIQWAQPVTVTWSGPELPLARSWSVDIIGDLNLDGAIEIILSKQSSRAAMTYGAILGTLRDNAFEPLAMTVTAPKIALTAEAKTVQAVQDAHDSCEHWRGEASDEPRRARDIADGVKKSCAAFKTQLAKGRHKYPKNETLAKLAAAQD